MNWAKLFRDRPDLEPPGYKECVEAMGYKPAEPPEEEEEECDIEF